MYAFETTIHILLILVIHKSCVDTDMPTQNLEYFKNVSNTFQKLLCRRVSMSACC